MEYNVKMDLKEIGYEDVDFIWPRMGISGGLFGQSNDIMWK